jgi:RNA ligase (TIGR02306 family)
VSAVRMILMIESRQTMNNKLAVIAQILALNPIEGADRIERATVLGWHVVVKKGIYKPGDLAVMIFPDSYAPKSYVDETYTGSEKVRIKTVKMRGQYSAGLVLPVSEVYAAAERKGHPSKVWEEGEEVSVLLDVEKWVAPSSECLSGETKGEFPTQILRKTDELNFRSHPEALQEAHTSDSFSDVEFVATLKCDGSSGTFIYKDGEFKVCGRNKEFRFSEKNSFWKVAQKYNIEEILKSQTCELALQGEVCGPGIQKNPMKLEGLTYMVFQIRDVTSHVWWDWDKVKEFCGKFGIPHVPEVTRFMFTKSTPSLDDLQKLANETKYDHGRANAEGVVIRPVRPIRSAALQQDWWSLKVMNQPYDMKKE